MKIFLDTNIFVEYIEHRMQFDDVQKMMHAAEDGRFLLLISNGSLYTLSFIVERALKSQGIHRPEQTQMIRKILSSILSVSNLCALSQSDAEIAIGNTAFSDLEDSFQYQCAVANGCDILVTINYKDFKLADQSTLQILTPSEFVREYL